jgi:hypothetical protein
MACMYINYVCTGTYVHYAYMHVNGNVNYLSKYYVSNFSGIFVIYSTALGEVHFFHECNLYLE